MSSRGLSNSRVPLILKSKCWSNKHKDYLLKLWSLEFRRVERILIPLLTVQIARKASTLSSIPSWQGMQSLARLFEWTIWESKCELSLQKNLRAWIQVDVRCHIRSSLHRLWLKRRRLFRMRTQIRDKMAQNLCYETVKSGQHPMVKSCQVRSIQSVLVS